MTSAIVYYSKHHGNTKKLLDALPQDGITLIDAENPVLTDLSGFDRIGFASGIYAGAFAKQVLTFAREHLPERKPVFLAATSAMKMNSHFTGMMHICSQKRCQVLGQYLCQGYNTYGPFKLIGGTSKGHPTQEEIDGFLKFYQTL